MEHGIVYSVAPGWAPPENGFVRGLPAEIYHSYRDGLSSGGAKLILESPAHWHRGEKKETEPLRFGRIMHTALLEPKHFRRWFIAAPKFEGEGSKKAKAEWLAAQPSLAIILKNVEEQVRITDMVQEILNHKYAVNLLKTGVAEISGFWIDKETGVKCRFRPDYLRSSSLGPMVLDYKTAQSVQYDKFQRSAYNCGYPLSAAWYSEGTHQVTGQPCASFIYIAQEKKKPYGIKIYPADDGFLEFGRLQMRKALRTFADCQASGVWPCYPEHPVNLGLPAYASLEGDDNDE